MNYVLAVDGGGTKTHALLCDLTGRDAFLETFDGTNHEYLAGGFDEVRRRLDLLFRKMAKSGEVAITHSVWGMAGLDTMVQHRILSDILKDIGVRDFTLANDSYLGIKAGTKRGYGICLINGTGSNTVGMNHLGECFQLGGQLLLTGDFGGGRIIGTAAVGMVYRNLFSHHFDTPLNNIMLDFYGITSKYDLMEHVMEGEHSGSVPISRLAKLVFDAANIGDPQAAGLLRRMAHSYALSIKSLLEELAYPDEEIEIVLVGSLFTKGWSDIHIRAMSEWLFENMPERQFNFIMLEKPPVIGALLWALENTGCEYARQIAHEVMNKVFPKKGIYLQE